MRIIRIIICFCCLLAAFSGVAGKDFRPDIRKGMTAPTRVVHLYPKGQQVDEGIVENGVRITLGPGGANRTDTTEFYWDRDGSLNAVGDSARIVLYLPQLNSPAEQATKATGTERSISSAANKDNLNGPAEQTGEGTGQLILVCPGGGYNELMYRSEGTYAAQVLTAKGYSVGIVCYRMPTGNGELPLRDVQNAFRYCRYHAKEWGISQIGIMGMSAGGHLAAMASTCWTDAQTRPDFAILFYPVVSADPDLMHRGSFIRLTGLDKQTLAAASQALAQEDRGEKTTQLLAREDRGEKALSAAGDNQGTVLAPADKKDEAALPEDPALEAAVNKIKRYATDRNVTPQTPPTLVFHSIDDGVSVENSLRYCERLFANGVKAALHIFPGGGHGWGFNTLETTGYTANQASNQTANQATNTTNKPAPYDKLGSNRQIFYAALFTFLDSLRDEPHAAQAPEKP